LVLALWVGGGLVLCFHFGSFPGNVGALIIFVLGAVLFTSQTRQGLKLSKNNGAYRISIDDFSLYVHSDDPASAASFTIVATDVCRLVRKTIKQSESTDEHEYYVETKSGTRHQLWQLLTLLDLDAMTIFKQIQERFTWVEIYEEVKQP